jgi:hypothetical protein
MIPTLSTLPALAAFVALVAAAWGLNVAALDGGIASLPWLIREQGCTSAACSPSA